MLFEHVIRGPIQSGKTTILLGFLERLHREGIPVLYVAFSVDQAKYMRQRKTFVPCVSKFHLELVENHQLRAIGIDDSERCSKDEIEFLRQKLINVGGPTQLLLVETV